MALAARRKEAEAALGRADVLLGHIAETMDALEAAEREMNAKIETIRGTYASRLESLQGILGGLEKELRSWLMRYEEEIFGPETQRDVWVRCSKGTLVRQWERRVKRARGVLEALEKLGRMEAIKVAKSVHWDALERWSDEELRAVGTERVERALYGWDVGRGVRVAR